MAARIPGSEKLFASCSPQDSARLRTTDYSNPKELVAVTAFIVLSPVKRMWSRH